MSTTTISAAFGILLFLPTAVCTAQADTANPDRRDPDRTVGDHVLNCIESESHHIYADTETCPLGGEEFRVLRLGTHSTFGVSLDWERMSYLRFPVPLPVCPSNGYVMDGEELSHDAFATRKAVIESAEYRSVYEQRHATFYLYARLMKMLNENEDNWWWFYREATSEADLCRDPGRYRQYAMAVIEEGETRMQQLDDTSDEYWILSIVIPNMYRRMGAFQEAQAWLDDFYESADADKLEEYTLGHTLLRQAIAAKRRDRVPMREDELAPEE